MLWRCYGDAMEMLWRCYGDAMEMLWSFFRNLYEKNITKSAAWRRILFKHQLRAKSKGEQIHAPLAGNLLVNVFTREWIHSWQSLHLATRGRISHVGHDELADFNFRGYRAELFNAALSQAMGKGLDELRWLTLCQRLQTT